jgi:hypothetical protein
MWDGVLSEDMLSDEGMEFANDYFDSEWGCFYMIMKQRSLEKNHCIL